MRTQAVLATKAMARVVGAALTGEPIKVNGTELKRRKDICEACEFYRKKRCLKCGCRLEAKRRLATEKCPTGKWAIGISIVIPARAEKEQLQLTIDSARAAGADEIIVVDDGENDPFSGADIVIREGKGRGPAACRNAGLHAATKDVIIFSDSHVRFPADSFASWAVQLMFSDCVESAAVQSLGGSRNWTGFGGRLTPIKAGYDAKVAMKAAESCTALYGSVYAASRKTWDAVGGWPRTLGWGYNEQALSLACLFAGVKMRAYPELVTHHMFKKRFNYSVSNKKSRANRVLVHWYFFEDFWERWAPIFQQNLRDGWRVAEPYLQKPDFIAERAKFQALKKQTDAEVYAVIDGNATPFIHADRRKDSPVDINRVALFTPHAPGREWALKGYTDAVMQAGHTINRLVMMLDSRRDDVRAAWPKAHFLTHAPLAARTAKAMASHMSSLWNTAIDSGLTDDVRWVWSLEDDVVPPAGTLKRLLGIAQAHPGIGIVSTPLRARTRSGKPGHLMIYRRKSNDPFVIDRQFRYKHTTGVHDVGSVHVGCTLIRADLLKGFRFTATPNDGKGGFGHEWSLMKHCAMRGLRIVVDFGLDVQHVSVNHTVSGLA